MTDNDLINAAIAARQNAYGRYSGFNVGAVIIDDNGRSHTGCNVENGVHPLGSCAEAGAISAMILDGGKRIAKIAVAGGMKGDEPSACTPCGGCRQRISEFADDDTVILAIDDTLQWQRFSMAELLPAGFRLKD